MMQHMCVTGATSGIGRGIAQQAAAAKMGLTITGLEAESDIAPLITALTEAGAAFVHYYQVDLSDGDVARQMVSAAADKAGQLDILVNNAGIQHVAPVESFPVAQWDKVIAVNLSAAFHTTAIAVPLMRQAGFGRIINIASVHGLVASVQKAAYVAAKHGIIGLTKTVALEIAEANMTCNAICPGWVRTPLVEAQIEAKAQASGLTVEEQAKQLVTEKQPKPDFATPDQIGDMVLYLASDAAKMVNGASFTIDGAWSAQ